MTSLAYATDEGVVDTNPLSKTPRERLRQARDHRRQFEPIWQLNAAFAAGQHWLVVDRLTRTLRRVQDVDPAYRQRELLAFDRINEYRTTALGELATDDDRPQLLFSRNDQLSEDYQPQVNRALAYGWDNEWDGDGALAEADQIAIDLGTAAIQCYWDPTQGSVRSDEVPMHNGMPVPHSEAYALLSNGPTTDVQMGQVRNGKICWRPLSPWAMLPPPGVAHEKYFPWEGIVIPTPVQDIKDRYGPVAASIKEDSDIASTMGQPSNGTSSGVSQWMVGESRRQRLRDHAWLFTYFERPTSQFPCGRTLVFASNTMTLVDYEEMLPIQAPDGTYRSGVEYTHWWRVTGRFFSRSLVSSLQDIQRAMNKRQTQKSEIIDRSMPMLLVPEGTNVENRKGIPVEVVEASNMAGGGAPQWIALPAGITNVFDQDMEAMNDALQHASGIRAPSLGENPQNVGTYAQLNLLFQSDQTKRLPMMRHRANTIKRLVENSVFYIRRYWGYDKQLMIAGDDDQVQADVFDATKIPPFYIVRVAKGSVQPRFQAAQLKLIEDIWGAAVESQAVLQKPDEWLKWRVDSTEAGQPLEIPSADADVQEEKAERENEVLQQGKDVVPDYYDPPDVHIPIHRTAQIQARLTGDRKVWQKIEDHIKMHQQLATAAMQATVNAAGAPGVGQPGQGPSAPAPTSVIPPGAAPPAQPGGAPAPGQASPPAPAGRASPPRQA